MNENTKIGMDYSDDRLDIASLKIVVQQFISGLNIIGWKKYGSEDNAFCPFESLIGKNREIWIKTFFPNQLPQLPSEDCVYDIRWMPDFKAPRSCVVKISYKCRNNIIKTAWRPMLVAKDCKTSVLFVWYKESQEWYIFKLDSGNGENVFLKLMKIFYH